MKILVDTQSGNIQGVYNFPLPFSISGKYVVDLPASAGPVPVNDQNLATFLTAKQSALAGLHPLMSQSFNDEFLNTSGIDLILSSRIVVSPNKRTVILPGGELFTNQLNITIPSLNRVVVHYYGFLANPKIEQVSTQTGPAPFLYGWNQNTSSYQDFGPGIFQVDLMDSIGTTVLVSNLQSSDEYTYLDTTPLNVRLKFQNLSATPWYISDYTLLVG